MIRSWNISCDKQFPIQPIHAPKSQWENTWSYLYLWRPYGKVFSTDDTLTLPQTSAGWHRIQRCPNLSAIWSLVKHSFKYHVHLWPWSVGRRYRRSRFWGLIGEFSFHTKMTRLWVWWCTFVWVYSNPSKRVQRLLLQTRGTSTMSMDWVARRQC